VSHFRQALFSRHSGMIIAGIQQILQIWLRDPTLYLDFYLVVSVPLWVSGYGEKTA